MQLDLTGCGELVITLPSGDRVTERAPTAWQRRGEARVPVEVRFHPEAQVLGFTVSHIDPALSLIIDPLMVSEAFVTQLRERRDDPSAAHHERVGDLAHARSPRTTPTGSLGTSGC